MMTATGTVSRHRPLLVNVTIGLLIFLGISAIAGGLALTLGKEEDGMLPPIEWLDAIPVVDSWLMPGLVLGIGFGLGALVTGYGVLRQPRWRWLGFVDGPTRHHWSWLATIVLGASHVMWIVLELVYLPELSILQAVYGPIGVALLVLPFTSTMSKHLNLTGHRSGAVRAQDTEAG